MWKTERHSKYSFDSAQNINKRKGQPLSRVTREEMWKLLSKIRIPGELLILILGALQMQEQQGGNNGNTDQHKTRSDGHHQEPQKRIQVLLDQDWGRLGEQGWQREGMAQLSSVERRDIDSRS